MSEFNDGLRRGQITFGDDFGSVAEVTHLFGRTATRLPYQCGFGIPGKEDTIALMLSKDGGNGWMNEREFGAKIDGRGWREIVQIREYNKNHEKSVEHVEKELDRPLTRYVFWNEEREGARWYKFYGTFLLDSEATQATLGTDRPMCIYRKIAETCGCEKADWKVTSLTDDEFKDFEGKKLVSVLLDELSAGRVFPGKKFVVDHVDGQKAICRDVSEEKAFDGSVEIPKRDVELGYFRVEC